MSLCFKVWDCHDAYIGLEHVGRAFADQVQLFCSPVERDCWQNGILDPFDESVVERE